MAATRSATQKKNTRSGTGSTTSSRVQKLTNSQWDHIMKKGMQQLKPAAPRGQAKRASSSSRTTQD